MRRRRCLDSRTDSEIRRSPATAAKGEHGEECRMKRVTKMLCALAAMAASMGAFAVEVTPDQAQTAVRNWIRKNPRPMTAQFATGNGEAKTFAKDGKTLFHVVQLDGGGFVVTSGDTKISPIVAFSDGGTFNADSRNPLFALLLRDIGDRMAGLKRAANKPAGQARLLAAPSGSAGMETVTEREWNELLDDTPKARLLSVNASSSLSDVRVEPIVKSEWDQSTWGYRQGAPDVYNYYTKNHVVCGCVATAGAQIMRYWKFPTASISAKEFDCFYNNGPTRFKMKGGTYDWNNMPLKYADAPNISDEQREAIGRLTYDVGVASRMNYTDTANGSGTMGPYLAEAMKSVFGYKSATSYLPLCDIGSGVDVACRDAILASLDAGMPAFMGVQGNGGHEIVADGYGFKGATLYVHLNCGWSGGECPDGVDENVWYDIFNESLTHFKFTSIQDIGYNIHPNVAGEVISGRVLASDGSLVNGATVTLTKGTSTQTAQTNARGIYYFRITSVGNYSLSAQKDSRSSKSAHVELQKQSSPALLSDWDGSTASIGSTGYVANKWGVDLTLESESEVIPDNPVVEQVKAPSFTPTAGSFESSSLSVTMSCGTSGATIYYTKDGSTPTTSSIRYSGTVNINATTTFKAIAVKSGMADSDVAVKTYTKNKPSVSVNDALDDDTRIYTVSESAGAIGQDEVTHDGMDALKVTCSKTTETTIETTLSGTGTLSFWWCDPSATQRTAIDGSWSDYLSYFSYTVTRSDGTTAASGTCSGPEWEKCEIPLPSGSYTITWKLRYGWPAAARTAYLDEVSFSVYSGGGRTVYFNANGADGGSLPQSSVTVAFADKVTLPSSGTLYKDGCLFNGWATSPAALLPDYRVDQEIVVGAQDIHLYAVWKSVITVLSEIPQGGGEIERPLSCYGTHFRVLASSPEWAGPFVVRGDDWSYQVSGAWFEFVRGGPFRVAFSAEGNDSPEDRSYDLYVDALDYPYVIVYHVVQKADVVTDKPKGLVLDGASSVVASSGAAFGSQVVRRNGAVSDVSPTWEIVSGGSYASVSASGQLTAKSVTSLQTVTLRATYEEGGVECTAEREVTVLPTCDLNAALDNADLVLQTGTGADAWFGQFDVSNDGTDAARASSASGGTPWIKTTVEGPAAVSFDCLMSADGGNTLYFVDNGKTNACAFSVPMTIPSWEHKTFYLLGEGAHVVEFVYAHEGGPTRNAGADAAWVDNLAVKPMDPGICEISLGSKGWHLVSFSALPDDPSPANVFADVADKIDQVVQGSKVWKPGSGGRLTEIEIGTGYWVRTKADNVSRVIAGVTNPGVEIALSKGWNLVGYPLLESASPATVLKTAFDEGKVSKIVSGSKVYPGRLAELSPGIGYWIYATEACKITFDGQ